MGDNYLTSEEGCGGNNEENIGPRSSTPTWAAPTAFNISIESIESMAESIQEAGQWPDSYYKDSLEEVNLEFTCGINCSCACCPVGQCDDCSDCRCRDSLPHDSDLDTISTPPGSNRGDSCRDSPVLFSPIFSCHSSMSDS